MAMSDAEFEAFLSTANRELHDKQERLKTQYGLGSYRRWWYEQATGKLQFFDADDALALQADIIHIGSFSAKSKAWQWAWSNTSIMPWWRQHSERLKELANLTGLELFAQERAFVLESPGMAWELAAIAVKHLDALGCYRAPHPASGVAAFFAITSLDRQPGDQ